MVRVLLSVVAVSVISLGASSAQACSADGEGCSCPLKSAEKRAEGKCEKKKEEKKKSDEAKEPAKEGSLVRDVDAVLAGKCACSSAADCTCKKGDCKCPKCGGKKTRMFETLKGQSDPARVPAGAKLDATAGIFI